MMGMILVNNPGSWQHIYSPLEHAHWDGWTPTDLVFPFFLWISGVSMAYSLKRRMDRGHHRRRILLRIARRSLVLFGLGLLLGIFPFGILPLQNLDPATIRIPGVLQRIALCYLATGFLFLYSRRRTLIVWTAFLLFFYYILMRMVPVPGYGVADWTPEGNLARFVDSHIFGAHTWTGAPARGFDPEGILSSLGAISTMLLGVLTGLWFRTKRKGEVLRIVLAILGGILLYFAGTFVDLWWPINKNLWTGSYVLLAGGLALLSLATLYWMFDRTDSVQAGMRWMGAIPILYGRNAITVYLLSGMLARLMIFTPARWVVPSLISVGSGSAAGATAAMAHAPVGGPAATLSLKTYIFQNYFLPVGDPFFASLLFALTMVLLFLPLLWIMDRKGWYLRV